MPWPCGKRRARRAFLESIQERIRERLAEYGLKLYVEGRVKSIYGIYRKMYMQGKSFEEIYDIYAVRVIVDTVNDCYNVLGIIHDMFRPHSQPFQGLHLHPEGQHVPVPAHHGHRQGGDSL